MVRFLIFSLEEGFPTIKGDGRHQSFVSEYNNNFHGACSKPAQSMKKVKLHQQLYLLIRMIKDGFYPTKQ